MTTSNLEEEVLAHEAESGLQRAHTFYLAPVVGTFK